jgi:hypothetical protein
MSKELFPDYVRVHYQQRADQAQREAERERLAKIARSNPHGVRRFIFTRLIVLLYRLKLARKPPTHRPTVRRRHV